MNENNYTASAINLNINEFIKNMFNEQNKHRNPHGPDKQVVCLDNFQTGELRIFKQFAPNTKPLEVKRMLFSEGNRLSLDGDFKGVVAGLSKDSTKKFELALVGFTPEEEKELREKEKLVNIK